MSFRWPFDNKHYKWYSDLSPEAVVFGLQKRTLPFSQRHPGVNTRISPPQNSATLYLQMEKEHRFLLMNYRVLSIRGHYRWYQPSIRGRIESRGRGSVVVCEPVYPSVALLAAMFTMPFLAVAVTPYRFEVALLALGIAICASSLYYRYMFVRAVPVRPLLHVVSKATGSNYTTVYVKCR